MDATWVFFFSFILSLVYLLKTNNTKNGNYPPSPPTIPILGNLLWFGKSLLEISPTLRRLRSSLGPVVSFQFGPFPAIFILDRDLAHQALVQKGAIFSDRPPFPPTGATAVFSSNGHIISSGRGSLWRLLRRNLTAKILHPSRLTGYSEGRKWVMELLLGEVREKAEKNGGVVVVVEAFRHAMFRLLLLMCFGEKMEDDVVAEIEEIRRELLLIGTDLYVFDLMPVVAKVVLWRRWRRFLAIRRRQEELYIPLIRSRRAEGGGLLSYIDSLLDLELPEEGGRKLTDNELVSLSSEFLDAGVDTATTTMEKAMANLVKHQQVQQKLLEEINRVVKEDEEIDENALKEMPYLKAVVLETLRRNPPTHFVLPHATTEEVELGPYMIPRGSSVNVATAEIGWDGAVWEEPFEFRPERFLGEGGDRENMVDVTGSREIKMMPFGAGRRICPGLGLAMLHLEYYLANLVREFEWRTEREGEEVDMSEKVEFTVVLKNCLRARIRRRREVLTRCCWISLFSCEDHVDVDRSPTFV